MTSPWAKRFTRCTEATGKGAMSTYISNNAHSSPLLLHQQPYSNRRLCICTETASSRSFRKTISIVISAVPTPWWLPRGCTLLFENRLLLEFLRSHSIQDLLFGLLGLRPRGTFFYSVMLVICRWTTVNELNKMWALCRSPLWVRSNLISVVVGRWQVAMA